jgi:hypothetical protein
MNESPINVSDLFPQQIDNLADQVRDHWSKSGGFAGRIGWEGASQDILKKMRGCVAVDPWEAFAGAWGKLRDLQAYKDESRHPRDTNEPYKLASNRVTLDAHPQVVVSIGPFRTPPIEFMYTIEALFETVTLTIRNGAITAAAVGACEVSGVLKTKGGAELHEPCKLPKFELPDGFEFRDPIPIP